jgi:hypothetical protein
MRAMDRRLQQFVRDRATNRCEYCHFPQAAHPQRFPIDHIIPRKHGGQDNEENLALCCPLCNWHKGTNLSGIDPEDGSIVRLIDPRRELWNEHFRWQGALLVGRSPSARATIVVMNINDPQRISIRELLISQRLLP